MSTFVSASRVLLTGHSYRRIKFIPAADVDNNLAAQSTFDLRRVESATVLARLDNGAICIKEQACCFGKDGEAAISVWVENKGGENKIIAWPFSIKVKLYYRKMFVETVVRVAPRASKAVIGYSLAQVDFVARINSKATTAMLAGLVKAEVQEDQATKQGLTVKASSMT